MSVREDHSTTRSTVSGNDDDDGIADWGELLRLEESHPNPYRSKSVLEFLYTGEGYTQQQIADRYGVTQQAVSKSMLRNGMEPTHCESGPLGCGLKDGSIPYRKWTPVDGDGERTTVYAHQLIALLANDPHEVFSPDKEVHHRLDSGMALDFGANLEVISTEEHRGRHSSESDHDVTEVLSELGGGD